MYSQNNEESFILDYFKDQPNGKFVDIGAYDVFRFSNTRALYDKGWRGVMVEPSPKNYKGLYDYYQYDNRITVHNFAIGKASGEIDFYESDGDAVSTTDTAHMSKWGAAGVKYEKIKVLQIATTSFMKAYGRECDFLSIDTEATNIEVFRQMPAWVWSRLKMLCIEHDGNQEEIMTVLAGYGFSTLHINAENIIMAK